MATIRVVGLGGSMRPGSASRSALDVALHGAAQAGADVDRFGVRELNLPMYVPGAPAPRSAERFTDAVAAANAMVWSSPMYHGSVSGSFKNAVDWLQLLSNRDPPYLTDKVIGLITTAGRSRRSGPYGSSRSRSATTPSSATTARMTCWFPRSSAPGRCRRVFLAEHLVDTPLVRGADRAGVAAS